MLQEILQLSLVENVLYIYKLYKFFDKYRQFCFSKIRLLHVNFVFHVIKSLYKKEKRNLR